MPCFAANLSMMFNEVPFLDRRTRRRKRASHQSNSVSLRSSGRDRRPALKAAGLTQALSTLPPGDWAAGEKGFAALPERFGDLKQSLHTALPYAQATGVKRLHLMAGIADRGDRRAVERSINRSPGRRNSLPRTASTS